MKVYEVERLVNNIGNRMSDVKVVINDEEYNIEDILWTGYENGNKILIKTKP
jgi:hypothetical protein